MVCYRNWKAPPAAVLETKSTVTQRRSTAVRAVSSTAPHTRHKSKADFQSPLGFSAAGLLKKLEFGKGL